MNKTKLIKWAENIDAKLFLSQRMTLDKVMNTFLDIDNQYDKRYYNKLTGLQNALDSLYDILNPVE